MNKLTTTYSEVVDIIKTARERAFSKVNEELILMYRDIGKYISEKSKDAKYGEKFVDEFVHRLKEYIHYWNNERISLTLNGMSPVQYRTHSQTI